MIFERLENHLVRLLDAITLTLMLGLLAVVTIAVIGRTTALISVPWSEEIAALTCLWLVSLGAAAAWARRAHIVIDVTLRRLPEKVHFVATLLIELASLTFFLVVFYGSYQMMWSSANNTTTALQISFTYIYLGLTVGLGLMIFFSLLHLLRMVIGGPAGVKPVGEGLAGGASMDKE